MREKTLSNSSTLWTLSKAVTGDCLEASSRISVFINSRHITGIRTSPALGTLFFSNMSLGSAAKCDPSFHHHGTLRGPPLRGLFCVSRAVWKNRRYLVRGWGGCCAAPTSRRPYGSYALPPASVSASPRCKLSDRSATLTTL